MELLPSNSDRRDDGWEVRLALQKQLPKTLRAQFTKVIVSSLLTKNNVQSVYFYGDRRSYRCLVFFDSVFIKYYTTNIAEQNCIHNAGANVKTRKVTPILRYIKAYYP